MTGLAVMLIMGMMCEKGCVLGDVCGYGLEIIGINWVVPKL